MRKFLYFLPAVLICMVYAILTILAGGISGYQPIVLVYIGCPILAGIFLRKGKWWGCLFGAAMGAILLYSGMTAEPQIFAGFVIGLILIAYYLAMGLSCAASNKK